VRTTLRRLWFLGVLLMPLGARAQAPVAETDAVRAALERSPRARAAHFDGRAADAAMRIAIGERAPSLTVSGSGGHTETLAAAMGGTLVRSQQDSIGVDSAVHLVTDVGTEIDLGLSSSVGWRAANLNPASPMINTIGPLYATTLTLDLRQPLFRGAGADATLAAIREATADARGAHLSARQSISELVRDVLVAHRELAYALDALDVSDQAVALAAEQAAQSRAREALGTVAHIESLRYASALATAESTRRSARATLETSALALAVLLGLSPEEAGTLHVAHADPTAATPASTEALAARAILSSPELAALAADIDTARELERASADADQVQLDLVGQLAGGVTYSSDTLRTLSLPDGRPAMSATVGIELTMPLGPAADRARHEQASAQLEATTARYETREREIVSEVATQRTTWLSANERAVLFADALAAASQLARAEREALQLGTATGIEVVQAQQDERTAALQALRAVADRREAEIALAHLTGTLLDAFHVRVDDEAE